MPSQGPDVFSLRDSVIQEYRNFATSFTTIFADDIRQQIEAIYASNRYWPEPLIQINPSFRRATTVEALAAEGALQPKTADIFRLPRRADGSTRSRPLPSPRPAAASLLPPARDRESRSASSSPSSMR
jgi:hypothetical protein